LLRGVDGNDGVYNFLFFGVWVARGGIVGLRDGGRDGAGPDEAAREGP